MKPDGTIVAVGASDPDTDHPKSKDLIYVLRSSLQDLAEQNQCKAVAMVFDVTVTLPNSDPKSDAIQVSVEHSEGYSAEVFFPYQLAGNKVVYGGRHLPNGAKPKCSHRSRFPYGGKRDGHISRFGLKFASPREFPYLEGMTVQLKPETERLVQEEIKNGHVRSVDELIVQGVRALREKSRAGKRASASRKPRKNLADVLSEPPFAGSELDLTRQKDYPRPLDL
jgi:Arc/MetJ-type ribon-helix-helix transcriptional regulator